MGYAVTHDITHRIAAMLTSAAAEPDWRRTWARVNRAAGMVASEAVASPVYVEDPEWAGQRAQDLIASIAPLVVHDDPRRVKMVVDGLNKRTGRALVEWYTGTSPEEGGKARGGNEGPEVDNG